jgi:hypothetical protein
LHQRQRCFYTLEEATGSNTLHPASNNVKTEAANDATKGEEPIRGTNIDGAIHNDTKERIIEQNEETSTNTTPTIFARETEAQQKHLLALSM